MKIITACVIIFISITIVEPGKTKRGVYGGHNNNGGVEGLDLPAFHKPSDVYGPPGFGSQPSPSYGPPSSGGGFGSEATLGKVFLGKEFRRHVDVVKKVGVYVARPVPYQVERKVPVRVPHPVDVPVDSPYPVKVPVKVPVAVYKDIPYHIVKKLPIPIEVGHVKVPIHVPVKIYHYEKVPIHIVKKIPVPVPDPIIIKKHIPVAVRTYLEPVDPHHHHHHWN